MKHGHTRLLVTILLLLMPGVPTRAQTSTAEFLPEFDDSRSTRLTRRPATLTSSCWRQAWLESQGSECIRLVSAVFRDGSTHKFAWNDGSETQNTLQHQTRSRGILLRRTGRTQNPTQQF